MRASKVQVVDFLVFFKAVRCGVLCHGVFYVRVARWSDYHPSHQFAGRSYTPPFSASVCVEEGNRKLFRSVFANAWGGHFTEANVHVRCYLGVFPIVCFSREVPRQLDLFRYHAYVVDSVAFLGVGGFEEFLPGLFAGYDRLP